MKNCMGKMWLLMSNTIVKGKVQRIKHGYTCDKKY